MIQQNKTSILGSFIYCVALMSENQKWQALTGTEKCDKIVFALHSSVTAEKDILKSVI